MEPKGAIILDYDGTVADNGIIPAYLVTILNQARQEGYRLVLASGRPKKYLADQFNAHFGKNYLAEEGVIFESCGLWLFAHKEPNIAGNGLLPKQVEQIEEWLKQNPQYFKGLTKLPGSEDFTIRTCRVTQDFVAGQASKPEVLQAAYEQTVPAFRAAFPNLKAKITKTRDSIDFEGEGVDKSQAVQKYIEVTKIPIEYIICGGDAKNDLGMLELIAEKGTSFFVGKDPQDRERARKNSIILSNEGAYGPQATAQILKEILDY